MYEDRASRPTFFLPSAIMLKMTGKLASGMVAALGLGLFAFSLGRSQMPRASGTATRSAVSSVGRRRRFAYHERDFHPLMQERRAAIEHLGTWLGIGLAACWIPAVRAARIDPSISMRT